MTTTTIASEIDAYIKQHGGGYPAWYVGIAADPRERLFTDHKVREHGDAWIYRDAGSEAAARAVERAFLNVGCQGGGGGGDNDTHYVYAYRIAAHTRE